MNRERAAANREPAALLMEELPNRAALDDLVAIVQGRLGGRLRRFRVSLREGGLVLAGCTRTYHAKQLVQHAVMDAINVPIRNNDIEVA